MTLKVVFEPMKTNKKLFVKEYLIDKCELGEPAKISIKENGHVQVKDKNDKELYFKTDNDSRFSRISTLNYSTLVRFNLILINPIFYRFTFSIW